MVGGRPLEFALSLFLLFFLRYSFLNDVSVLFSSIKNVVVVLRVCMNNVFFIMLSFGFVEWRCFVTMAW